MYMKKEWFRWASMANLANVVVGVSVDGHGGGSEVLGSLRYRAMFRINVQFAYQR